MNDHLQLGFDGQAAPWEEAQKPPASKAVRRKKNRETIDNMIIGWMKLWNEALMSQEICSRLEKLTNTTQSAVDASLYRLWKAKQVRRKGHPDGMPINQCGVDETWRLR